MLCQLSYAPRGCATDSSRGPSRVLSWPRLRRRPALGALFLVLAIAFVGIAAAAAEAVDTNKGLVVLVVAAGAIALWMLSLSIRNLRKPPS